LDAGTTGRAAKNIKELADADVVLTSLPLPTDVEGIMLGEEGLLNAMKAGSTYIDVSTIDPQTARRLSDAAEARGIAGIEPALLVKLLGDTGAKSFQLDLRGPWIANGDFENRFGLDLALKDVRLGCEMADEWGNDAKTMKVALDYFKKATAEGLGKEDCNAIYKIIK